MYHNKKRLKELGKKSFGLALHVLIIIMIEPIDQLKLFSHVHLILTSMQFQLYQLFRGIISSQNVR